MCVALKCLRHAYFFQLSRFIAQCSSLARESYWALSHQLFFRYRNAILSAPEKAKAIAYLATEVQQKPGLLWQEALSLVPRWLWAAPKQVEAPQHHLAHLCELIFPWWCQQSMFLPCAQQGGDMDANPFFAPPLSFPVAKAGLGELNACVTLLSLLGLKFILLSDFAPTPTLLFVVCFFSFFFSSYFFFGNIVLSYSWVCA